MPTRSRRLKPAVAGPGEILPPLSPIHANLNTWVWVGSGQTPRAIPRHPSDAHALEPPGPNGHRTSQAARAGARPFIAAFSPPKMACPTARRSPFPDFEGIPPGTSDAQTCRVGPPSSHSPYTFPDRTITHARVSVNRPGAFPGRSRHRAACSPHAHRVLPRYSPLDPRPQGHLRPLSAHPPPPGGPHGLPHTPVP